MSFLFPEFLWALVALVIPIAVHLFNFRRTVQVRYSATYFLRKAHKKLAYRNTLKHYLVLLSRILFILFLVMTFAQPFLPAEEATEDDRQVTIYLDNSLSMSVSHQQGLSALDVGLHFIRTLVEQFPVGTTYRLIDNNFLPFSNSFKSNEKMLDDLAQTKFSSLTRTTEEIKRKIEADSSRGNIFWISDFQQSTFRPDSFFRDSRIRLIPVTSPLRANVFVDSVYLDNPHAIGRQSNRLNVRLSNVGYDQQKEITVNLIINENQAGVASVTLVPHQLSEVSFDIRDNLKASNRVLIRIDDTPIVFDNDFYFALNFSKTIRVAEIRDNLTNNHIEKVFGNQALFHYRSFDPDNIDYGFLAKADLLVVNGINHIDDLLASRLTSLLDDVGVLLFIPGGDPDVRSYTQFLGLESLTKSTLTQSMRLDVPDVNHPFFDGIFQHDISFPSMPNARRVLRWRGELSPVLQFQDTHPFMSQRGKIVLMASPLQQGYTDFYAHTLFLPIMYKIASFSHPVGQKGYYSFTDNTAVIYDKSDHKEQHLVHLVSPHQQMIPVQHKTNDKVVLHFPKFSMKQGFYQVLYGKDTLTTFAMNLDKRESLLDSYDMQEIISFSGKEKEVFQLAEVNFFENEIKKRFLNEHLWRYFLFLCLLFLLVETLIIRYFR